MRKQIYTMRTLSDLYRLTMYDLERIALTEGEVNISLTNRCIYLYLPVLDEKMHYPAQIHQRFIEKLKPEDYTLSLDDTILRVEAQQHSPASLLMAPFARGLIENYIDIMPDTAMLFSTRTDLPIFIGHGKMIDRLADDFDTLDGVVTFDDFEQWKEAYVQSK